MRKTKKKNEYNQTIGQQSVPGGTVSVISVSDNTVGMRSFFDRPVAVGVRGVIMKLRVEAITCKDKDCTGKDYFEVVTIADYANKTKH